MERICDLHIHSKYSGGTSNRIDIFNIASNCKIKGIDIVGTGDCFHPFWLKELKDNLVEYSSGFFRVEQVPEVSFILQTEVEVIWKYNSQVKNAHFLILIPNFEKLDEVIGFLSKLSNLSNGRPKVFISPEKLILNLKSIENLIEIIPAHIFTPYFGILGSKLHFNSIYEALGQGVEHVYSVETGLSADPQMVRMISELNRFSIISNSDCHSINFHRLGREGTAINFNKLNYPNLIDSIRRNKIVKTYEFKPSEGRYFYNGHRAERHFNGIEYYCSPKRNINKCPNCGKELTRGVLSRVYELRDQEPPNHHNFQYIVPLLYLISITLGGTEYTKKNLLIYQKLIRDNKGEYNIWNGNSNYNGIPNELINAIEKIRSGKYWFLPGYDGVYGQLQFEA